MSRVIEAAGPTAITEEASSTAGLSTLYAARFAFAVVWAGLLAATASTLGPVSVTRLVLYPLVDAAAAVIDFRSSGATRPRGPLLLNVALNLLAVAGLAVAAASGIPSVLWVWGAWAITAGVVQLVLSGGISTLAGTGFILMAAGSEPSLANLAGYAALGGVFFLVSAIRLHRSHAS